MELRQTKRPALLFYNHGGEVSGAEVILLELLSGFANSSLPESYRLILVCPAQGALWERAAQINNLELQPVRPLRIGYTRNPLVLMGYLWQIVRLCFTLLMLVVRYRVCLIHANSIRGGLIACLIAPFLLGRVKVAVHLHDALGHKRADKIIKFLFAWLAWRLIAISDYTRQTIVQGNPRLAAKCVRIYNGVNLQSFDPARFNPETARAKLLNEWPNLTDKTAWPLMAIVGQITPWKGHAEALAALAKVREQYPQTRLLIVGGLKFAFQSARYNNAAFKAELDQLIEQKGLQDAVWFCGERHDIAEIMAAIDILLVPSWVEPFGRVVIEAMAMVRTVVAGAAGGPLEIIEDGRSGRLFKPKDSAALTATLIELAATPALLPNIGQQARQRVIRQFSSQLMLDNFLELYAAAAPLVRANLPIEVK